MLDDRGNGIVISSLRVAHLHEADSRAQLLIRALAGGARGDKARHAEQGDGRAADRGARPRALRENSDA
jgi:hypothetical protein